MSINPNIVQPSAPRHTTQDLGHALRVTLPSRRRWLVIIPNGLFVLVWAALLIGGLVFGGSALIEVAVRQPALLAESLLPIGFFVVWAALFSVGGLTALYEVLWNLTGREVIEVSLTAIRLSRLVAQWGRTREYAAQHITDLRVSPQLAPAWYGRRSFWPRPNLGQMAFDYGAQTIRFADADEAEAKMILAEIQKRFPQYI